MFKSASVGLAAVAAVSLSHVASASVLDFETAGQYSGNFDILFNGMSAPVQTGPSVDNDYVRLAKDAADTQRTALVYDTTPGDGAATKSTFSLTPGGTGLTVSADVLFNGTSNGPSWGIYFINASNRQEAFLAIFNVNASGANDNIRFTRSTAVGYLDPTSSGSTETGLSLSDSDIADAGFTINELKNIAVTYSINGSNQVVMSMTAGTRTLTSSPITTLAAFTQVEVGIRASPQGGATTWVDFDNFAINIPEPASMALIGLAGLMLLPRRRLV